MGNITRIKADGVANFAKRILFLVFSHMSKELFTAKTLHNAQKIEKWGGVNCCVTTFLEAGQRSFRKLDKWRISRSGVKKYNTLYGRPACNRVVAIFVLAQVSGPSMRPKCLAQASGPSIWFKYLAQVSDLSVWLKCQTQVSGQSVWLKCLAQVSGPSV
jgi:hypothetical protein